MTPHGGPRPGSGRPAKAAEEKAKRQTFALYPATLTLIKEGASRLGFSQAKLIDAAIREYLGRHEAPPV